MNKLPIWKWVSRGYMVLTAPKILIICGISVFIFFFGFLGAAIGVANSFQAPYTIWGNYISDLGSLSYTPAPFLFDTALILGGILMIPSFFYLEKYIGEFSLVTKDLPVHMRILYKLRRLNLVFNLIGAISMIFIGIFSVDRDIGSVHDIFTAMLFVSFVIGGVFIGVRVLTKQKLIPKPYNYLLGVYGICVPVPIGITGIVIFLGNHPLSHLFEWIILFTVLGVIIPLQLSALRHATKQLKA